MVWISVLKGRILTLLPRQTGAATSTVPSQALFEGDENVATPFLLSNGGSVGIRPFWSQSGLSTGFRFHG